MVREANDEIVEQYLLDFVQRLPVGHAFAKEFTKSVEEHCLPESDPRLEGGRKLFVLPMSPKVLDFAVKAMVNSTRPERQGVVLHLTGEDRLYVSLEWRRALWVCLRGCVRGGGGGYDRISVLGVVVRSRLSRDEINPNHNQPRNARHVLPLVLLLSELV